MGGDIRKGRVNGNPEEKDCARKISEGLISNIYKLGVLRHLESVGILEEHFVLCLKKTLIFPRKTKPPKMHVIRKFNHYRQNIEAVVINCFA